MKLVTSSPEETLRRVRHLSENAINKPARKIFTVPHGVQPLGCALASVDPGDQLLALARAEQHVETRGRKPGNGPTIGDFIERFRHEEAGNNDEFTSGDVLIFLTTKCGWTYNDHLLQQIGAKLRQLCNAGDLFEVGHENGSIIWRFPFVANPNA